MDKISVASFADICGGRLFHTKGNEIISHFCLNSKSILPNSLFIAVKGARVDGNNYVEDALANGSVAALTEKELSYPSVQVPNIIEAIAKYGAYRRDQFQGEVICVTGSNGKTSTKEFIAQVLEGNNDVLKSFGNKNTSYTSPALWHHVSDEHKYVIAELGMRSAGKIRNLAKVHRPTIAVITMIGSNHIEFFGSKEGIAHAKCELFEELDSSALAIYSADDSFHHIMEQKAGCAKKTFGFSENANCRVIGYRMINWKESEVMLEINKDKYHFTIPVAGKHQALNAAIAVLIAAELGLNVKECCEKLKYTKMPEMRMEHQMLSNGCTALIDAYNASPDSVCAAVKVLSESSVPGKKVVVLGDMLELGSYEKLGCEQVARSISEAFPDDVLLFGGQAEYIASGLVQLGYPAENIKKMDSIESISQYLFTLGDKDLVLLKASRSIGLPRAVEPLLSVGLV